uniref:Uncharacterized protein n=1 Tax=Rhizophora mucronata TaxID=61149 RepID=A0A2P2IXK5_RHIMU
MQSTSFKRSQVIYVHNGLILKVLTS